MRGRKPKPTQLKLVTGNPGKRRLNRREPKPRRVIPSPPEHLPKACLPHWGRFAGYFDRMGVLTEVDGPALERLCCLYQEMIDLAAIITKKGGRFYTTTNTAGDKMIRPHPAVAQLSDADRRFRGYWSDFGGTPSARVRVQTEDPDADQDPAAKHFG